MTTAPLRLVFDPVGDELAAARACEADVFWAAFENSPEELAEEYGPYEDQTGFITILAEDGEAVAAMRFIAPGPAGLKTLNDLSRPPWRVDGVAALREAGFDPERTWDVATIAVRKGKGLGGLCAAAMYHAIIVSTLANDSDTIVMLMDAPALSLLRSVSLPVNALPGTFAGEYLGSTATTPVTGDLLHAFGPMKEVDPESHRLIREGIGFEELIELPTDWTWHRRALRD